MIFFLARFNKDKHVADLFHSFLFFFWFSVFLFFFLFVFNNINNRVTFTPFV